MTVSTVINLAQQLKDEYDDVSTRKQKKQVSKRKILTTFVYICMCNVYMCNGLGLGANKFFFFAHKRTV